MTEHEGTDPARLGSQQSTQLKKDLIDVLTRGLETVRESLKYGDKENVWCTFLYHSPKGGGCGGFYWGPAEEPREGEGRAPETPAL
jgi:hypothetical protein